MDNGQNPTSSQSIFSSSHLPSGESIFGTFSQASQGAAYTSATPKDPAKVQPPKKHVFGSIGESSGVNWHTSQLPSSSRPGGTDQIISQHKPTNASHGIFGQNLHKFSSKEPASGASPQLHGSESDQSRDLKRKQAFMKKMISQSIFGAKLPKTSPQAARNPMQDRGVIQKRPFAAADYPLPAEGGLAKRRSLRDVYPVKAAGLGRKKSVMQEQQTADEGRPSSSRMSATTPTNPRRRQLSSGIAEQVAASTTIICHEVPDNMNNENSLRQHFGSFGEIIKIATNMDKRTATIGYKTHEMAAAAKSQGYQDHETNTTLKIYYLKKVRKSLDKNPFKVDDGSQIKSSGVSSRPRVSPQCNIKSSHPAIFARNDSEKLAILERLDSLLRKQIVRQSDINTAKSCKGTCVDMCPEKERYLRQERKILAIYETRGDLVDHARAVKEYSRSSADQEEPLPHELRPGNVLQMTMHYLLYEMMPKLYEGQIADWYDFLWNRSRAIRKELSVQQICDITAVHINEQCARFHIFCAHELSGQDRMVFDPKINNENLEKTMKTVIDLYQDLYFAAQNGQSKLPLVNSNVAELFSYYILLNINRTADVLNELQELPQAIRYDGKIAVAMDAFMALHSNNYVKFFNVVRRATFLQGCILHRYFMQVRKEAVHTISKAFSFAQKTKTVLFPGQDIIRILNFNGIEDLESFCLHFGIPLNTEGMLELTRAGIQENEGSAPIVPSDEVKTKLGNRNIAEVIANCSLGPILHEPYSSFDSDGKYIGEHSSLLASARSLPEVAAPKSKNLQFNVNMLEVKNVAKQLFHEVINEMCLSVANQSRNEANEARWNIIFMHMFEQIIKENLTDVAKTAINDIREEKLRDELHRKKLEQERRQRELLEREEQRKRQLRILVEKRELERLKKQKEIEMLNLRLQLSSQICKELCETVISSEIQKLIHGVVEETRLDQRSNEELDSIEHFVVSQNVKDICKSVWKESKLKMCMKIRKTVLQLRLKRYFVKWQDRKLLQMRFKILTQTFPTVPIFRMSKSQVRELLPKQPQILLNNKATCFPLDHNVTVSVQTPMEMLQRQIKFIDMLSASSSDIEKQCDRASSLPFCTMLYEARKQHDLQDASTTWKISLRIPFASSDSMVLSWLSRIFFPSGKNLSIFSDEEDVKVSCQRISDNSPAADLFGSSSVVLCLNKPVVEEPNQEYWDFVRSEMELLVSNRPALPAIPLLVVSVGWDCCQETLCDELGFSLLSFAFSRWTVCTISDNSEYILENYNSIRSGIQFLFEEIPVLPDLTTMPLRELLEDTLMKEYVLPVSQHTSLCKKMFQLPIGPCTLIRFYNFIIESLANIVSCHQLSEISWPPIEITSNGGDDLWNGRWNSEEKLMCKFDTIIRCKLPPFPENYELATVQDLGRVALDYGKLACPNCPGIMNIIEDRLNSELHKFANEIYLDDSFYEAEKDIFMMFDWHSVLDVIICQHLTNLLYQQSKVGDITVTFLTEDLKAMEKYQEFEEIKLELGYTALEDPDLAETVAPVIPQFSEIIDDQFSHLDYSIPSPNIETSCTDRNSDTTIIETMKLLEEAKLEREISSITTERLSELANEIEMAL